MEITRPRGITDADVVGRKIDDAAIIIVRHASLGRQMC